MKRASCVVGFIVFTMLSFTKCFANRDSLWSIWADDKQADTLRLKALHAVASDYYLYNNPDSAIILYQSYLGFAQKMNNKKEVAFALRLIGAAHQVAGNQEEALSFYEQAYEAALQLGDKDGALKATLNANMVYKTQGKWKEVIKNLTPLLPELIANEDWYNVTTIRGTLASLYGEQGLYQQSLTMALENYALLSHVGASDQIEIIEDVASAYADIQDFKTAIQYYEKALEISEKLNEKLTVLGQIGNLVNLKLEIKDTTNLAYYINRGETLANDFEGSYKWVMWKYQLSEYYMDYGFPKQADTLLQWIAEVVEAKKFEALKIYIDHAIGVNSIDLKYFDKAIEYCKRSYEHSKAQLQSLEMTQLNCDCLYKAYKALGQVAEALPYLEESYALRDTLFNEETTKATTRLTMQYEFDLEKEQTERSYQAQRQRQQLIQYGLIGGLGLMAMLAFFIYRNYRNKAKANQLIAAQKAELEALNATKDRLFAIIGHDLRKPSLAFRGIGKKIDYLLQKQDFDTLSKLSQALEQAAFSLNALLDNLLNWALQQRNVLPYQPVPINIAQATQDIYEQFRALAAQKDIDLQFDLSTDAEVFADANAFATIMRNLVDNAIKFTPAQGRVKVSSLVQGDQVVLQISDTGIGMEAEELNTLFRLTRQKSRKGTNGEVGTGLGLVLTNELVKLNKGVIQVSSQLQQGTTFKVMLPTS